MTDRATLEARLAEAETAYRALLLGQTVQAAGLDGRNVTYTPANAASLAAYIQSLKAQLGRGPRRFFTPRF